MDGLNTLSEEEQESAKAQTEDSQQQTKLLQSNIEQYVSLPVCHERPVIGLFLFSVFDELRRVTQTRGIT